MAVEEQSKNTVMTIEEARAGAKMYMRLKRHGRDYVAQAGRKSKSDSHKKRVNQARYKKDQAVLKAEKALLNLPQKKIGRPTTSISHKKRVAEKARNRRLEKSALLRAEKLKKSALLRAEKLKILYQVQI